MGFDELRRNAPAPASPPQGERDIWATMRASESWTEGFTVTFARGASVGEVNDFLDEDRTSAPAARIETDLRGRRLRVLLPAGTPIEAYRAWVHILEASPLFEPEAPEPHPGPSGFGGNR